MKYAATVPASPSSAYVDLLDRARAIGRGREEGGMENMKEKRNVAKPLQRDNTVVRNKAPRADPVKIACANGPPVM